MADLLGSVVVNKRLRNHPVWERMDYGYCWIDLLMLANDEPRRAFVNGAPYELERGQLIWSKKSLEKEWRKSGEWLEKFLSFCQDQEMVRVDSNPRRTIITILNYDAYNPPKPATEPAADTDTEAVTDTERNGEVGSGNRNDERARAEKTTNNFDAGLHRGHQEKNPPAAGQVSKNKKTAGHAAQYLDSRTPAQARFEIAKELAAVSARLDADAELNRPPDQEDRKREKELKAALAAIGKE